MMVVDDGKILLLPSDVMLNIFCRIPLESLLQCKLVSKSWLLILSKQHKYFSNMHARQQLDDQNHHISSHYGFILLSNIDDYDTSPVNSTTDIDHHHQHFHLIKFIDDDKNKVDLKKIDHPLPLVGLGVYNWRLVGSCNGLVCLATFHGFIYICNPITGEYVFPPNDFNKTMDSMVFGFGYHPYTNEYKVVRIYPSEVDDDDHYQDVQVEVYTLGSNKWRRRKGEIILSDCFKPCSEGGVLVNGTLHWLMNDQIVSFDLGNEECHAVIPLPPSYTGIDMRTVFLELGVLSECLCLIQNTHRKALLEVWVLNKYNNNNGHNWTKEISIDVTVSSGDYIYTLNSLAVMKNGQFLFWSYCCLLFSCYDPKTQKFQVLFGSQKMMNKSFWVVPLIESFVSLIALGEKDAKKIIRKGSTEAKDDAKKR